ncbi:COQ7 protein [Amanita rubescens]|nr:COQ7 protein [Amanita rubescens]
MTLLRIRLHSFPFSRGFAHRAQPSAIYLDPLRCNDLSVSTSPEALTAEQQRTLDSAIRVDQAGEVAANWIYKGQFHVLRRDQITGPLIQEMWDQEKKHLEVMDKIQLQHEIRPTILLEVAKIAGFGLGAATALMGREAAMACTEAVETVIGEHYDDQLREMDGLPANHPSVALLKAVVQEFRDDELEHLNIAVDNHSQRAPAHALLSSIVGAGCKIAIELCKRI